MTGGEMAGPLFDVTQLRDKPVQALKQFVRDAVLVFASVWLVVLAVGWRRLREPLAEPSVIVGLTVLASVAALAVGVLAILIARVTSSGRASWIGAAYTTYALVAIPTTLLSSAFEIGRAGTSSLRLAGHITVVVLLLFSCRTALDPVARSATLVTLGVAVPAAVGALALAHPAAALAVTDARTIRLAVCLGWIVAAVLMIYRGMVVRVVATMRIGLGTLLIASAHSYRVYAEAAPSAALPSVVFSSVRLVGLVVVLTGMLELARRSFRGLWDGQLASEEELLRARRTLERRAERNHELRNGVAGIAGAASLLRRSPTAAPSEAMSARITELTTLLNDDRRAATTQTPSAVPDE